MINVRDLFFVLKSFVVPPSIKGGNVTTEISALINSVIKLQCETRGLPVPAVTWYKDGQLVLSGSQALYSDKGQFLHIPHAQVSDSATYLCRVTNVAGTAEKSFQVDIYGKEKRCLNWLPLYLLNC
jgi:hemicentin